MGTGQSVEHHVHRGASQLCASDTENRQMHAARAANINLTQVPFDYLQVSDRDRGLHCTYRRFCTSCALASIPSCNQDRTVMRGITDDAGKIDGFR